VLKLGRHHAIVKGFALIELLVVMSIIALLMEVLLPALRRARGAAAATVVCAGSNRMRQPMLAAGTNAVDYDDSLPIPVYRRGWQWSVGQHREMLECSGVQAVNSIGANIAVQTNRCETIRMTQIAHLTGGMSYKCTNNLITPG
jgi:prepilin-type N-terminal cleavage/methylation domain-containing protein